MKTKTLMEEDDSKMGVKECGHLEAFFISS